MSAFDIVKMCFTGFLSNVAGCLEWNFVTQLEYEAPRTATDNDEVEIYLIHTYTGTVMKEQDGWHFLPAFSFIEIECMSGLNQKPHL